MRPLNTIVAILVCIGSLTYGQNFFPILGGQRTGTSSFTFLKIGVNAQATGMGEAVIAMNHGASSVYYNPAIIAQLSGLQMSADHINWPADIQYDYMAISSHVLGRHYIGVNAGILHMAPMEETTEYLPGGTGNFFSYQDRFIGLTYGAKMTERFSFGITVKHVSEQLAEESMSVVLMDMGTFYNTGFRSLRFSTSLSHFGPQAKPTGSYIKRSLDHETGSEVEIETEYEKFSPPTVFRVGAAIDVYTSKSQTVFLSVQLNHPVDDSENIAAGLEYQLLNIFYLRAGYKANRIVENWSAGVGLSIPLGRAKLMVDYGYTNFVYLSDPKRFSISFSF